MIITVYNNWLVSKARLQMSLLSLFKNTNSNNPQTLLVGEDSFFNDYLARSLIREKKFVNYEKLIIDCETDGLDDLIANMTESSLFGQRKMIIIKSPFFLTAKQPKKDQKKIKQLEKIFTNVKQFEDIIILVASYEKLDRRKKLTKIVLSQLNVIDTKVKTYEVSKVINAIIKAENYQISKAALKLLLERSDQILDTALSNFNKLKVAAVDHQITEALIDQNIDLSFAQNVFAILESALKHNYREALKRLDNQLREGSSPVQLLAVFENQLELILVSKILQKRGRSESEIVKEIAVHPYRVKLALKNSLSIQQLANLLEQAIIFDYNYKNGRYHDNSFLKLFILSA